MLDFIAIEHGIMGEDLLKEYPQFGNVPLPVTKVVNEIPDCFLGRYFEGIVEAVVGCENLQVGIQHHKWLAHGFYNVLGIFPGILDFRFQLLALGNVLNGEEDHLRADVFPIYPVGIEQHDFTTDVPEKMDNLEVV